MSPSLPFHSPFTSISFSSFPFYIAQRYLFSKKSTNAINVISIISVVGVAVATMALVVVMSVFNGFHDLVASFFTAFDPQLKVVAVEGKTMSAEDPVLAKIRMMPEVEMVSETVEDQAMAYYNDRQAMVTVKGVDRNFSRLSHITDILYGDGQYQLQAANLEYGIVGVRLAAQLGMSARWPGFLKVYAPKRQGQLVDVTMAEEGFVVDSLISPGVVFVVNQSKYDKGHIITSIDFARQLFDLDGRVSALELRLREGSDLGKVKEEMRRVAGAKYRVIDRYEQQEDTFRIMQIEKMIAYLFLTFILVVACFNIIGSLSMLIIDKRDDVETLRCLGANDRQISRIFLFEGRLIAVVGAGVGIVLGLLLCWLQQQFGLIKMGGGDGTFIINAYPVSVHYSDVALVFLTVVIVGCLAVWYPVRYLSRRLLTKDSK